MRQTKATGIHADGHLPPERIRAELARVLESPAFKATPQRRRMLTYVVEEMLAGRGNEIKGYAIGVSVFGRADDFDPNSDPLVRLEARRLRHDLDSYYVSEGRNDPLRITIPTGRYLPEFVDQEDEIDAGNNTTPAAIAAGTAERRPDRRSFWVFSATAIAIAVIAAVASIWLYRSDGGDGALATPTIVVPPFEVLSTNQEDRFLAAGIAGQIVADLNRFPDIRIFSPRTSFTPDASAGSIEFGKDLGGSYVVMGQLRSSVSSVNVAARLVDSKSGEVLWTETYERELAPEDLMAIQSDIAAGIATALGQPYGVIRSEITKGIPDDGTLSQSSYACVLRGYYFRRTYSPDLYPQTLACLEKAVQTDPDYAEAWAMLGLLHFISTALSILPADPAKNYDTGIEAARRSIEIDPENVLAFKVLSGIYHYQGNYDEAERYVRLALEINPNDPDTLYQLGWRLAIRGRFEEGIPLVQRAIDRTVNSPPPYYHLLAVDRLMQKDGKGMLPFAQRAAVDGSAISQSLVAMANGLLGDQKAAEQAIARMNEITPGYDPIDRWRAHQATDEVIAEMRAALPNAVQPSASATTGQH